MKDLGNLAKQVMANRCPRCGQAPVFVGIVKMNPHCPACEYVYKREPGYFIGAMFFSYIFGSLSVVPTVVGGTLFFNYEIATVVAIASAQICLLAPLLFRFSRLFWIFLDFHADSSEVPHV